MEGSTKIYWRLNWQKGVIDGTRARGTRELAAGLRAGSTVGGGASPSLVNVRGARLQEDAEGYCL